MPSNTTKLLIIINLILEVLTWQARGLSLDGVCDEGSKLTVMFWLHQPYVTRSNNGTISGIFPDLLQSMVNRCCHSETQLLYQPAEGPADFYTAIEDLRNVRNSAKFDLAMPLHKSIHGKSSFQTLPYLAITESLGIAVLKHSNISSGKLVSSFFQAWPVLIFIIITALIAGIIIWFVERRTNSKQFASSFPRGAFDGFWWAFISMTSVGYGDKYPKSVIGKLLGSSWIILGMLFVTMFVGTLTTTLMTLMMAGTHNIQNEKISVVNGSEAHWLGLSHHAMVKVVTKQEDLYPPLVNYKVDAALVDINSLKDVVHNLEKKHNIRVQGMLHRETFYGIVLSQGSTNLSTCFQEFLEKHEDLIYDKLSQYSGTQKNDLDPAEDYFGSGGIFSISVFFMIGVFFTLCICGVIWEMHKHRLMTYQEDNGAHEQETNSPILESSTNSRFTRRGSSPSERIPFECTNDEKTNGEFGILIDSRQSQV